MQMKGEEEREDKGLENTPSRHEASKGRTHDVQEDDTIHHHQREPQIGLVNHKVVEKLTASGASHHILL